MRPHSYSAKGLMVKKKKKDTSVFLFKQSSSAARVDGSKASQMISDPSQSFPSHF